MPRSHPSVREGRAEGNDDGTVAIGVGRNREGGHGLVGKSFAGGVMPQEGCVVGGRRSGWLAVAGGGFHGGCGRLRRRWWLAGASATVARSEGAPN